MTRVSPNETEADHMITSNAPSTLAPMSGDGMSVVRNNSNPPEFSALPQPPRAPLPPLVSAPLEKAEDSPKSTTGTSAREVQRSGITSGYTVQTYEALMNEHGVRAGHMRTLGDTDEHISFSDKVSYFVENTLSASPLMKVVWLGIFTVILLTMFAFLYTAANQNCLATNHEEECSDYGSLRNFDAFFATWMFIAVGGGVEEAVDFWERSCVSCMILAGMFTFAILVGFITDGITQAMDEMSSGRTKVIAKNHTLLLGWNESTLRLLVQIATTRMDHQRNRRWAWLFFWQKRKSAANKLCTGSTVIMANNKTKEEMDNEIRFALAERGIPTWSTQVGTNIVCRVGDPTSMHDLLRVGTQRAAVIAVMCTEADEQEEEENEEARVYNGATLRTLLGIRQIHSRHMASRPEKQNQSAHVVVQLSAPSPYVSAACWQNRKGVDMVHPLFIKEKLNALLFTCAVQKGLSEVLMEMLSFEGAELKILDVDRNFPDFVGMTAETLLFSLDSAVMFGIKHSRRPNAKTGKPYTIELNPDGNTIIQSGDSIVLLTDSEDIERVENSVVEMHIASKAKIRNPAGSRSMSVNYAAYVLVCGWREEWQYPELFHKLLRDVSGIASAGTKLVFLNLMEAEPFSKLFYIEENHGERVRLREGWKMDTETDLHGRVQKSFSNQTLEIVHYSGDAAHVEVLEPILKKHPFDTAIVLGTQKGVTLSKSLRDSRVLSVLLLLRHLRASTPTNFGLHVVGEIGDDETSGLAALPAPDMMDLAQPPDFINVNALVARCISQVLACPDMDTIWTELLSSDGSEIYIKPVEAFLGKCSGTEPIKFAQVISAVRAIHPRDVCLGFKSKDGRMMMAPTLTSMHQYHGKEKLVILSASN